MSYRNSAQVRGAVAESRVLQLLLESGAAVNGLTADDSGWDLHLHLPVEPMTVASKRAFKDDWELSGRSAHVQVKSRSDIKQYSKLHGISTSTLRGWVTASAVGTPTFLILLSSDPESPEMLYLDPHDLSEYATDGDDSTTLHLNHRENSFIPQFFGYDADLWSRYAPAMFQLGELAQNYMRQRNDYDTDLGALSRVLGAAALPIRLKNPSSEDRSAAVDEISQLLQEHLNYGVADDSVVYDQLAQEISDASPSLDNEWYDPNYPPSAFSMHTTWYEFKSDLGNLAAALGAAAREHLSLKQQRSSQAISARQRNKS